MIAERLRRNEGREWLLVGAGLSLLVGLFWLSRILLSGTAVKLLTSDIFLYYLPIYETLYGAARSGTLPVWNPYQLGGLPGLAALQAGFFYPGHLAYWLLPVKVAFGVTSVAHIGLAAVTMAMLVRRIGLGLPAAIGAAIWIGLRGRYPGMVFFPNMLEAAAWLPLGAIGVLGIARSDDLRAAARAAAVLAFCTGMSLLAGYPQVSVYVVYTWGALLLLFLAGEWPFSRPGLQTARAIGFFALGLALGIGLTSIQLLPGIELTGEGTRSPGPLSRWQQFPFGWFGPGLYDAFTQTLGAPFPKLPLSLGAVGLVLLPLSLLERQRRVLAIGSLAFAALVVLFAMGPATSAFDWIAELPALGWFRFPRRSLFMADFFIALALAVALQRLATADSGRGDLGPATPLLAVASGAAAVAVAVAGWAGGSAAVVFFGLAAGAIIAVVAMGVGGRLRALVAPGLVLLAAVELFAAEPNRQMLYFVPGSMEVYGREREIFRHVSATGERAWIRSVGINPPLPPKLATYFRIRSVGDYEPLNLRRQAEFFTYLMEGRVSPKRRGRPYSGRLKHLTAPTYPGALTQRGRLLDVAAVRWLIVARLAASKGELAEYIRDRGLVPQPIDDPDFVLLENPHASPRAFSVHDLRVAPEPSALMEAMSQPEFDPLAQSYVEGGVPSELAGAPHSASNPRKPRGRPARIVRDDATVVEIEARLDGPGMLVLTDSFYPGWRASVDGKPLQIYAVNHLFRGVALGAGTHRVRFEYVPSMLYAGAAISGLAALATLALFVLGLRSGHWRAEPGSDSIRADAELSP